MTKEYPIMDRFHGFDLQRRNDWPRRWRARLRVNKNEREDYRLIAWGDTAEQAVRELQFKVLELDIAAHAD